MAKRKLSFYHIWLMFLQTAHHLSTRAIISEVIYVDYTQTIYSYVYWDLSDISIGGLMVKSLYTHQHHPDLSCGREENGLVRSQYPLPTHFLLSFTYLLEQYGEFNQCREFFILHTTDVHQNFQLDKNCLLKYTHIYTHIDRGFPGGSGGKESACNAGDLGSIPGLGGSLGEGNVNPLQYSCLENPMDRGAWQATVHRVAKSRIRLSD